MKKRFLPLMLALVLCLGLTVPAMAAEATFEEAIPCNYVSVGSFHEGLAWMCGTVDGKDQYGFINKKGEVAIPAAYDDVLDFSEGLAAVKKDEKWGFIDKTGKEVVPCIYDGTVSFYEGLAAVVQDGKGGYIDQTGEVVIPFNSYDYVGGFSEGLALV